MNPAVGIQCFIDYVVQGLAQEPEQVVVTTHHADDGQIVYQISTAVKDISRIMGRDGAGLSAIRNLAAAGAKAHGLLVKVLLNGEADVRTRPNSAARGGAGGNTRRRPRH